MRILVVEDEHRMALYISQALIEEGFAVDLAHDGARGLELAQTYDYDGVVLDLMLPRLDGLALCRRLREAGRQVPVLILSARDMVEDRVRGLDAGADDYLIKPFAVAELTARLRALQRRHQRTEIPTLTVGALELDPATRVVRQAGRAVSLTQKEYALLEYLMRRSGYVLTRSMIAEHVWDFTFDHASNVVDVYVKHLRGKIDEPGRQSFIQAVRGVGYVLRDPATAAT
ncbi:MAG: response regulator transcription factor [Acidobacteria bacterium]|nr:response regulator transcription factor [Acidobacteriota bacterium]